MPAMQIIRLFSPVLAEGQLTLSPEESHHAAVALRLRSGQEVMLFDGAGREACGTIVSADRRGMRIKAGPVTQRPFEFCRRLTLAVAMPRTHRQGYLIEKCTELRVAAIWPVLAERSVAGRRSDWVERWSRRAVEAAKQSGRAWVPTIETPRRAPELLERCGGFHALALSHSCSSAGAFSAFLEARPEARSILVLVGPEGGWAPGEVAMFREAGAEPVTLGPSVLRTETAAVAVCAIAAALDSSTSPQCAS